MGDLVAARAPSRPGDADNFRADAQAPRSPGIAQAEFYSCDSRLSGSHFPEADPPNLTTSKPAEVHLERVVTRLALFIDMGRDLRARYDPAWDLERN